MILFFIDPVSLVRDHTIKVKLAEHGICVQSFKGDLLYEPWEVYDEEGHAFTTFNAFWDKCVNLSIEPASVFPPWKLVPPAGLLQTNSHTYYIILLTTGNESVFKVQTHPFMFNAIG